MSKSKIPEEIAGIVEYTMREQAPGLLAHDTITFVDDSSFLLEDGQELPEPRALVVLRCTWNRPRWWIPSGARTDWSLTGKNEDIYLWQIVK